MIKTAEIRRKIEKEFTSRHPIPSLETIGLVGVFSADEVGVVGENAERFLTAFNLVRDNEAKTIIFLGTKNHNYHLKNYLKNKDYKCRIVFLGENEMERNTLMQVEDLTKLINEMGAKAVLLVSSNYHIPRIRRYVKKYLQSVNVNFLGTGSLVKEKIEEEIKKIIMYSKKGYLPLFT